MTLAEIAAQLAERGIRFADKPELHVRWSMKHHKTVFDRAGRGVYVLKEWPPEMKRLSPPPALFERA